MRNRAWRVADVADVEGTKGGCGLQETMSSHGSHETSFDGFACPILSPREKVCFNEAGKMETNKLSARRARRARRAGRARRARRAPRVADVEGTRGGCGLLDTMRYHGSHETSFGGCACPILFSRDKVCAQ
jgi:hypothetical protein